VSTQHRAPQAPTKARLARQERAAALEAKAADEARRKKRQLVAVVVSALAVFGTVAVLALTGGTSNDADVAKGYSASQEAFVLPGLLDDQPVRLADHAGKPLVVNFFASWCVYCNEELPGFVEVAKATQGSVDFVGVDTYDTGDGATMARRFDLPTVGFDLARDVGKDPASEYWRTFGGQGLPVTAFYDAKGKLVDFAGGMLNQVELQDRIKKNYGIDVKAADASTLAAPVIPLIPQGAYELLARNAGNPAYVILDVRTPGEYAGAKLPGAVNLDAEGPGFEAALAGLDKEKNYFVYCHTGNRSSKATERMHELGFKHVYDIQGGITAWQQEGLPVSG
jgi:rhodanese-related sulfurtransferase/thiol-disulfide isomerase/thioredoxin